ncbi:ParB/RepB/Spo0J family partition protein (plasmid) [Streptomyces sp. NBC_01224]|uniref:ParB/RepB/Spo0J family partition protein n=1 Tax=Streptomyces sp. NBC_01224 TaxID=2903783 RepID=UPI002E141BE1|nr:ParB/RepB/Spo0J family partition protein [Streptomyces sp. NBC_01224]
MSNRVADQLGTGASFSRARGGVSARRQAVAATTGAPTTGAPDSRLRTLPLGQLVPTRFNPRRNFGTEEDLREFGLKLKKKQLQPAVAVTRQAYLALWPGEADSVGSAVYVIANGERRYRASKAAGLPTVEVVVDDEVAKSRADFLDAVLAENNDREDLDPVERALGIRTMVEELGGKAKVAEHYGKSGGWVTQQMYLLDLAPTLQELVSSGELPVRETRTLVKLPTDQQVAAWQARSAEREEDKAQPKAPRKKRPAGLDAAQPPSDAEKGFTAVKRTVSANSSFATPAERETDESVREDAAAGAQGFTAVKPWETSIPDPRWTRSDSDQPEVILPTLDPADLAELVIAQMTPDARKKLTTLLITYNSSEVDQRGKVRDGPAA